MSTDINLKTDRDFDIWVNHLRSKYGEDFEILNGFHDSQLNFSDFIDNFIDKNTVADASIDSNANNHTKDICSLLTEQVKPHNKLFGFNKIFYEIKKKYGLEIARDWLENEWNGAFYLHNANTSSYKHYCWASSLTRLAKEGLFFLKDYNYQAPKHLTTFLDDVIEFISFFSNRSSGAVGIPDVLIWTWWFWKKDVDSGFYIKDPDYYMRQCFQKLIYRMNQNFIRINEAAFTNVSIYDRCYLEDVFGGMEYPDGEFVIDHIEEIIEHQKVFMDVIAQTRKENMFTFPVLSTMLMYKDGKFQDEEFAKWSCKRNMEWNDSNFFISSSTGILSNCCFSGTQQVKIRHNDATLRLMFKIAYDKFKDTNIEIYNKGHYSPGKIIRLPADRPMFTVKTMGGRTIYLTDNHINVTHRGLVETKDLKLSDHLAYYGDRDGSIKYDQIYTIEEYQNNPNDPYVYCFEMDNKNDPFFTLDNNIHTHNCRLLSDTKKLNTFINSIGGTAISVGSCQVNTINLLRIAYESNCDKDTYLDILKKRTKLCVKVLDIVRHIIKRNIEKGLLPNFCDGGVELNRLYNTIGINGLYETIEKMGMIEEDEVGNVFYTKEGIDFANKIFDIINEIKDNFECDYSHNIEQIPAERAAVIFAAKDRLLYNRNSDKFIYSNQWYPLWKKTTLQSKLEVSAILDQRCNGGSVVHINIDSEFPNFDVAWDTLNAIAKSGVYYFAYNSRINECPNHHGFVGSNKCPECGEGVIDTWQRVVGFLTPTRSYSKERFKEFNTRYWYDIINEKLDF